MTDDGSAATGDESTVRRWFGDLVDLDEAERRTRLRELEQREDPERGAALRARLEALLAADRTIDERLAPYEEAAARLLLDVTSSGALPATGPDPLGLVGTTMGRYQIGPVLGAGGMGVVYRATDTRLDRPVALKFLTPTLGLEPSAKRRLLREARTAAALDHPNVCTIYEVDDTEDGRLYIAMPSYDGETLRARLERGGIEVAEAVELAIQAARGLAAAHDRGLVHRDVKPDNLFLTRDSTVVVLDFGIARAAAGGEALTRPGQRPGTAAYMAPEQARGDVAGPAADVFGLGVVLHEMLCGRRPAAGEGADGADGPSAASIPGVPPAVAGLLARMLATDPRARPTAAELARLDLADLTAAPQDAAPSRATTPSPEATRSVAGLPVSRRWAIGLASAAASTLLVAAAWLTLGGLRDAPASNDREEALSEAQSLATAADPGIAVVPFRTVGVDSTYWGTGIVELLSFNFDELQGLRKIDPRTVLTHWRGLDTSRGTPDSLLAHQVARVTGARYAVLGNAVRLSATGDMRLTARVYDAQREGFRGAVRVDGPPDSVNQLIDRLTIEVLRESLIPLDVERPSVNLSRLTTASLPAMKAYLEGEQAYRRMNWWAAVPHYQAAVELDSTFARAYLRLGQAYNWRDLTSRDLAAAAHARAAELSDALPERDARLMKLAANRFTQIAELEDFTRAYPDDPDGWFMLADALFHAQYLDVPPERYRRAFERAVRIAPHYAEAYYHLVDDAVVHRDRERVAEFAAAYESLQDIGVGCGGLTILHNYLWGDSEARSAAVDALQTVDSREIRCIWVARAAMGPMMELSEERLLDPARVTPLELWMMMGTRLYNGWPTQAARVLSVAAENPTYRGFEAGNRIMMYLAGYADTLEAERWKQTLRSHSMLGAERGNPAGPVVDYFWIAALALEQGRRDEFEAALASMDSVARASSQQSGVREDRLAAYAVALRQFASLGDGQWEGLGEFEAALEELVMISTIAEYPSHYMRFEVGKRLLEEGRPREAERYLVSIYPFALPYFVPAQFYLGHAYEELGERDEARERYRLFVEWWAEAEPHLQPWRDEAVEALRRLAPDP